MQNTREGRAKLLAIYTRSTRPKVKSNGGNSTNPNAMPVDVSRRITNVQQSVDERQKQSEKKATIEMGSGADGKRRRTGPKEKAYDGNKTSRAKKAQFYSAVKKGRTKMDKSVRGGAKHTMGKKGGAAKGGGGKKGGRK